MDRSSFPAGALRPDPALVQRLDVAGPRYTSYPSANHFHEGVGAADLLGALAPGAGPMALYVHVPFCASPCFYCGCNRVITRRADPVARYLDGIAREAALHAAGAGGRRVEQIHLGGGTPTHLDDVQIARLLDALGRVFDLQGGDAAERSIEVDPRTVDAARMAALRRLGFNRVSLGVQDLDARVQRAVNRVQPRERIAEVIGAARREGFRSVSVDLILGLPHQDRDSFARTLDQVLELGPDRLALFGYAHLPARFPAQRRMAADALPSAEARVAMLLHAVARIGDAGYVLIGMDHFARAGDDLARALAGGTLHRNFQGYSTRAGLDLLGLGPSAISAAGPVYAQNHVDLARWHQDLDAGRLPVARGRVLDEGDLLRRDVIHAAMCRDVVQFGPIEDAHGIRFAQAFAGELEELRGLAGDGLVEVEADRLRVTPLGRLFRRRLAMVFDAYLEPASRATHARIV